MQNNIQPHARNLALANATPRCGAKTRAGHPCKSPAVSGKRRCRMHGGAKGSGAPKCNKNALVHGRYTLAKKAESKAAKHLMRECMRIIANMDNGAPYGE